MFFSKKSLLVLLLMVFSSASIANTWSPTDDNVNLFLQEGSYKFGIFDDSDVSLSSVELEVNVASGFFGGATINFAKYADPSDDWMITSGQKVAGTTDGTLSDSSAFRLAIWDMGIWKMASSATSASASSDSWVFGFDTTDGEKVALGVDMSPISYESGDENMSPVPLPGAVWLMTFAFGSLFAFGRRKMNS